MKTKSYLPARIHAVAITVLLAIFLTGCAAIDSTLSQSHVRSQLRWWKGNTHTHTFWSDGQDYPEMVVKWYKQHGYNFLTLSDHNILSQGQKWVDVAGVHVEAAIFDKYLKQFGPGWI